MGTAQSSARKAVEAPAIPSDDALSSAFERAAVAERRKEFFADSPVKSSSAVTAGSAGSSFWSIDLFGLSQSHYAKVLFCGRDHFPSGFIYTKEALQSHANIVVVQCDATELATEIEDAHVIVPLMTKISRDLIEKAPYLNLIMQFGVGLEGVDIDAATEAGVAVASIPSDQVGNAQSCAEHAIFLCISLLRQTKMMEMSIVEGRLGVPTGRTIMGSSVMIFGFGGLGKELAKRLFAFNPKRLVAVKRSPWIGPPPQKIDEVGTMRDLPRLLKGVDIVFICCSQNQSNLGVVNKSFIDVLNRQAIIVNIARGGLLNYQDVLDALNSDRLAGFAMDVYKEEPFPQSDPFVKHPKVVCTPHVAGVTESSYREMAREVADNVLRLLNEQDLKNVVNY